MGHIDHQVGTTAIGDFTEPGEIDNPRVGRTTSDDQLWLVFISQLLDFIIIDQGIFTAHTILDGVEPFAGHVGGSTMGQVTTSRQRHAENGITRLEQGQEHALIGLGAGMRLNIGPAAVEQLLGAFDRQLFGEVNILTTTVIAAAGIALSVFVGQHGTLSLKHCAGHDVFRGNQLNAVTLPCQFVINGRVQCRIAILEVRIKKSFHLIHFFYLSKNSLLTDLS